MHTTRLRVICDSSFAEILMAEIAQVGFDTFMETENGFEAYVEGNSFSQEDLNAVKEKYRAKTNLLIYQDTVKKQNWNEEWEKNYHPIIVENKCMIRASFHSPDPAYSYDIVITPKMSFGTGHHETTYLMIKNQLEIDHAGKQVMDAGCGTAVLSIMACKRGALQVEAFDIDEWSIVNGKENALVNQCPQINIQQGKLKDLSLHADFDLILANINKNILLEELPLYVKHLRPGGKILLSGFYVEDAPALEASGNDLGLHVLRQDERNRWSSLLMQKAKP